MNPAYPVVSERAEHRCEYCRAPELVFNFPFEVEHIVPVCRGGANTDANLALACRSCNLPAPIPLPVRKSACSTPDKIAAPTTCGPILKPAR